MNQNTIIERLEEAQAQCCGCTDMYVFEDAAALIKTLERQVVAYKATLRQREDDLNVARSS